MIKRLLARLGFGGPAVDHAQTKEELQEQQGDHMRSTNMREWGPNWVGTRNKGFVDEGRPKK